MSAPGAPNVYKQPYASPSTLEFNWTPPSTNGGSPITGYRFTLQPGSIVDYAGPNDRYKTIPQLRDDTLYTTSIEATNDNGLTYGTPSFFRPFQPGTITAFGPSTVSAATLGVNSAIVSWTPPIVQPISQNYWYVIYGRSSSAADPITSTSVSALSRSNCIVPNLNSNSIYYFDVHAVNCPGWSPAVSSPTISWIIAPGWVFATNFNSGNDIGIVGYNTGLQVTTTITGAGFAYNTSNQTSNLYLSNNQMSNTNTVSFTASIYPRNNTTGFANIFASRGYPSPCCAFELTGSGGNLGYNWNDQASAYGYDTGVPITVNQWQHVALVVSPSNAKWYKNGTLCNTTPTTSHAALTFNRWDIGQDFGFVPGRNFPGYIDNIRVYNRCLTDSEISAIYQNTLVV